MSVPSAWTRNADVITLSPEFTVKQILGPVDYVDSAKCLCGKRAHIMLTTNWLDSVAEPAQPSYFVNHYKIRKVSLLFSALYTKCPYY